MSVYAGPEIVNDGLVLCLDAGNAKSYPGSGTAWTDLSGLGNNGTLTNGPTFDSANGSIVFDGSNDYVTRSNVIMLGGQNKKVTVEVAFYLPTTGGGYLVTNERESGSTGQGWYFCDTSQLYFSQHASNNPPYEFKAVASSTGFSNIRVNDWNIVSFAIDVSSSSTLTCNYMINGYTESISNNSVVWNNVVTNQDNIDIGRFRNYIYGTSYNNCRISTVRIYDRLLTYDEQLQNFNAIRGRFDI